MGLAENSPPNLQRPQVVLLRLSIVALIAVIPGQIVQGVSKVRVCHPENSPLDLKRPQVVLLRFGIVALVAVVDGQIVEAMSKVWMRCTAL